MKAIKTKVYQVQVNIGGRWHPYWRGDVYRDHELAKRELAKVRVGESPAMATAFRLTTLNLVDELNDTARKN